MMLEACAFAVALVLPFPHQKLEIVKYKIRNCEIEMSGIHTNVIDGVCWCVIGFPHVDWAWG
jgi:hypothetical protein